MKKLRILLLFFVCTLSLSAQNVNPAGDSLKNIIPKTDSFPHSILPFSGYSSGMGVVFAIHQGAYTFLEGGMSLWKEHYSRCAFGYSFVGNSISAEYNPINQRAGISLTRWISAGTIIAMGINVHSYTDFKTYTLGLRPSFGLGNGLFTLTYGYNFQLANRDIFPLNKHCISLRFHLYDMWGN